MVPSWNEISGARRAWEAVGAPVVWGIVCGLLLPVSAALYLAGSAIGILGGIGAGAQHDTRRDALRRGALGGTLFGLAILLGYELSGGSGAEVHLPEPAILLLAFTLIPAFPLHWLGWRLAHARRKTATAA